MNTNLYMKLSLSEHHILFHCPKVQDEDLQKSQDYLFLPGNAADLPEGLFFCVFKKSIERNYKGRIIKHEWQAVEGGKAFESLVF